MNILFSFSREIERERLGDCKTATPHFFDLKINFYLNISWILFMHSYCETSDALKCYANDVISTWFVWVVLVMAAVFFCIKNAEIFWENLNFLSGKFYRGNVGISFMQALALILCNFVTILYVQCSASLSLSCRLFSLSSKEIRFR